MIIPRKVTNSEVAATAAAHVLDDEFRVTKEPILFLVSGGSALDILEFIDISLLDGRVALGVLDERFTKVANDLSSNLVKLKQHKFFTSVENKLGQVLDIQGGSVEQAGDNWEYALRAWKKDHPNGRVFITQGIGVDGHTAGIMPFPEDPATFEKRCNNPHRWTIGYDAGNKNQFPLRITVTFPFLREVDVSVLIVCGQEKQHSLESTLARDGSLAATPARIIGEMRHVFLFTDITL